MHISSTTNVCYQYQVEVGVSINLKPYASPPPACYPSVRYRDYPGFVLGNVLENGLREVKMLLGRIAPAPCVVREGIVWWAEIGGGDQNGAGQAPFGVIHTPNLIARPTAQPIVEQSCA